MPGKLLDWESAAALVSTRQADGQRVVFTNGCFDIFHAGHVRLLEAARELGDFLIVGLNGAGSVERLKGPGRPFNNDHDRATVLSAMAAVDAVVIFPIGEPDDQNDLYDTPWALLSQLRPDILVKGGDYTPETVIGSEFAGEVCIIPLLEGRGTTEIIKRMKSA